MAIPLTSTAPKDWREMYNEKLYTPNPEPYNTKVPFDPNYKAPTPAAKEEPKNFNDAFKQAYNRGDKNFNWKGKDIKVELAAKPTSTSTSTPEPIKTTREYTPLESLQRKTNRVSIDINPLQGNTNRVSLEGENTLQRKYPTFQKEETNTFGYAKSQPVTLSSKPISNSLSPITLNTIPREETNTFGYIQPSYNRTPSRTFGLEDMKRNEVINRPDTLEEFDKPLSSTLKNPLTSKLEATTKYIPPKETPKEEPKVSTKEIVENTPKTPTAQISDNLSRFFQKQQLPSDVKNIVTSKEQNKKFETYNGKYYVLSKENGQLYAFDKNHNLLDSTIVGRGKTRGDFPNSSDTNSKTPGSHATTRAGSGVINEIDNGEYEKKHFGTPFNRIKFNDIWNDSEGLGLHGIYKDEYAFRKSVLDNPKILDKLMSWGCINSPKEFLLNKQTKPAIGDSIFITREPIRNLYANK